MALSSYFLTKGKLISDACAEHATQAALAAKGFNARYSGLASCYICSDATAPSFRSEQGARAAPAPASRHRWLPFLGVAGALGRWQMGRVSFVLLCSKAPAEQGSN
jgi:hypothetical protein